MDEEYLVRPVTGWVPYLGFTVSAELVFPAGTGETEYRETTRFWTGALASDFALRLGGGVNLPATAVLMHRWWREARGREPYGVGRHPFKYYWVRFYSGPGDTGLLLGGADVLTGRWWLGEGWWLR